MRVYRDARFFFGPILKKGTRAVTRNNEKTWCGLTLRFTVLTSVETSVSITNERSVPLTSKLSSELTSFIDVANMIF